MSGAPDWSTNTRLPATTGFWGNNGRAATLHNNAPLSGSRAMTVVAAELRMTAADPVTALTSSAGALHATMPVSGWIANPRSYTSPLANAIVDGALVSLVSGITEDWVAPLLSA